MNEVLKRLIAGASLLIVCMFLNCVSQILIERYFQDKVAGPRLFDVGFEYLPHVGNHKICDWLMSASTLATLGPLVALHPLRSQIVRRFVVLQAGIFLLRSISVIVTILPPPLPACIPDPVAGSPDENVFVEALRVMIGNRVTCGDCLFSGHAAHVTLMTFLGLKYYRQLVRPRLVWRLVQTLLWALCVATQVLIVLTRFHYSVDVLVSLLVVAKLCTLYHAGLQKLPCLSPNHPLAWYEFDHPRRGRRPSKPAAPTAETVNSASCAFELAESTHSLV